MQCVVVVVVTLAMVLHRLSSSRDDAEQQINASDIDPSQVPSSSRANKRGRGRKVDHPHHHPEPGCKFMVSWDEDKVVQDEIGVNLNHRMYALATNFSCFRWMFSGLIKSKNTSTMPCQLSRYDFYFNIHVYQSYMHFYFIIFMFYCRANLI